MKDVGGALFALVAIVAIVLGVYWLLWQLWTWVVPQLWPSGPEAFINPGFWLFAGAWLLVTWLGGAVFGRASRE